MGQDSRDGCSNSSEHQAGHQMDWGLAEGSQLRPSSSQALEATPDAHRMPSMVRLVSAMLVASTTLRAPGGVGSKMRACSGTSVGLRVGSGGGSWWCHMHLGIACDTPHSQRGKLAAAVTPGALSTSGWGRLMQGRSAQAHLHLRGQVGVDGRNHQLCNAAAQALGALAQQLLCRLNLLLAREEHQDVTSGLLGDGGRGG